VSETEIIKGRSCINIELQIFQRSRIKSSETPRLRSSNSVGRHVTWEESKLVSVSEAGRFECKSIGRIVRHIIIPRMPLECIRAGFFVEELTLKFSIR